MFSIDRDLCPVTYDIIKSNKSYGSFITVYVDKPTQLSKDKIACALITSNTLQKILHSEITLIQFETGNTQYEAYSNQILSYDALLAVVYTLKISGYKVTDIANAAYRLDNTLIALEGMDIESNIIKMSIPDEAVDIIDSVVSQSISKSNSDYILNQLVTTSKFENITEMEIQEDISNILYTIFPLEQIYSLNIKNETIQVYESQISVFTLYGGTLTMLSKIQDPDFIPLLLNTISGYNKSSREYCCKLINNISVLF